MSSFAAVTPVTTDTAVTTDPIDPTVPVPTYHVITAFYLLGLGSEIVVPVVSVVPSDFITVPAVTADPTVSDFTATPTVPAVTAVPAVPAVTAVPAVPAVPFVLMTDKVILSLTPETAQSLIDDFAACKCCERHRQNKPRLFDPFTKSLFFVSPKTDKPKPSECKCPCRKNARELCRNHALISGNDPELRKDLEDLEEWFAFEQD